MLGLSSSTEVNLNVTKTKLYGKVTLTPEERKIIKEQIELVNWRNKLAVSTMPISAGKTVIEILVFEVKLKQRGIDKRILFAIAKAIPYKVLFVLTFHDEAQAWVVVSDTFYSTDWQPFDELTLKFEGLNLDTLYENIARQIAGGRLGTGGNLEKAANRDKQRRKLEGDIVALENKKKREKQFNKRVEFNDEIKRIKKELKELEE